MSSATRWVQHCAGSNSSASCNARFNSVTVSFLRGETTEIGAEPSSTFTANRAHGWPR